MLFLCQACLGNQVRLVSGNNQPSDTLPTKAMVTFTSVEPTLPREVRGCCSCVKRALVTRRVLYQEIISPDRRNVQGCCSCVKHSLVTSRILYQKIISQVHMATAIAMLTQCKRCAPRRDYRGAGCHMGVGGGPRILFLRPTPTLWSQSHMRFEAAVPVSSVLWYPGESCIKK